MSELETPAIPDAEAALASLVERMRGAVAFDAVFVGIYSGGAWVAVRFRKVVGACDTCSVRVLPALISCARLVEPPG